jgi:hypothetical protein
MCKINEIFWWNGKEIVFLRKNNYMEALSIEVINPKAKALLFNMVELNLINIKPESLLKQRLAFLRRNEQAVPSMEEITREVELVRQRRYEQNNH